MEIDPIGRAIANVVVRPARSGPAERGWPRAGCLQQVRA
jgi:hypothetical protein